MPNVKYNVMLHSIRSQFRLYFTVFAMLVLTGCSTNINWFPSSQFTKDNWRHSPVLSVTQQCVDEIWHTRNIDTVDWRTCAELKIVIAEF